jgi:plastocyanin
VKIMLFLVAIVGCSSSTITPSAGTGSGSAALPAPQAPEVSKYVTRARPEQTFDMLTAPVAPGDTVTTIATLESGWSVTGQPQLVADPTTGDLATFEIVSTVTEGGVYKLVAKNVGAKPARLVADVPYTP